MNRRSFLRSSLALSSSAFIISPLLVFLSVQSGENPDSAAYLPGQTVPKAIFVLDKALERRPLVELCETSGAPVNVLYIYGGGSHTRTDKLGGIWCTDSFEDLHILRFLHEKYDEAEVGLIPVACPPLYSGGYYGFEDRVFLDEPDDSEIFRSSAEAFVESTEKAVVSGFVPVATYYDIRNRLLFNRRKDLLPAEGYGEIYDWQGKFRGEKESQKYGTPTVWLLDAKGTILEPPFRGNIYHSSPYEINYTIIDLDDAIQRHLSDQPSADR